MSAIQLRQEFNAIVEYALGEARNRALVYLRNNLPTAGGTLGNFTDYPSGVSLAGKDLYATGKLRDSYQEHTLIAGTPRSGRVATWSTNSEYAYYYANGRINSDTYHGFDFIEATKRDLEQSLRDITIRHQII